MNVTLKHLGWGLLAVLVSVFTLAGAALYWATPTMVVRNDSSATVQVTARWNAHHRELHDLQPGHARTFKVRGESTITFTVTYPDGSHVQSLPMYFTTATTVSAVITARSVSVSPQL